MNKWMKVALFTVPLVGAAYFFGALCGRFGTAYERILTPSTELLMLLLEFLLVSGVLLVCAGLVAVLLRPLWLAFAAFALSGVAML